MDWKPFLIGNALGWFAKWLHGALKIRPKSAAQADKVISTIVGTPEGTAQHILDGVETVVDTAVANAAVKAVGKPADPGAGTP